MIEPWVYPVLTATAVLTGFIDAVAGGGGLIMLPALLFSGASPIQALATNKLQSVFGTAVATRNYARAGLVNWRDHKLAMASSSSSVRPRGSPRSNRGCSLCSA